MYNSELNVAVLHRASTLFSVSDYIRIHGVSKCYSRHYRCHQSTRLPRVEPFPNVQLHRRWWRRPAPSSTRFWRG